MSDLISRADAVRLLVERYKFTTSEATEILSALPSAETTGALDDAIAKYVADGLMELPSAEAADVYKAHEEEHLKIINRIKELQYALAKTQTIVGKMVESAEAVNGECRTCGRNADNGGEYEDGRTKCPIQEHYALLKDGYCHLYEPYREDDEV